MGRIVHLFVRLVAATIAIAIVIAALLAMRLAAGPVSLGVFAPSLAKVLEDVTPYRFRIGDLAVLWRDWRHGLLVRLDDVQVTSDDGGERARIDELAVGFSPWAMARGVIAPTSIDAADAEVTLDPGQLSASPDSADFQGLDDLFSGLRGPPDTEHPLSFLETAMLRNVSIGVRNPSRGDPATGGGWRLLVKHAKLARDDIGRLTGDAALILARGDEHADVSIALAPTAAAEDLSLDLTFTNLRPAAFADALPVLAPLIAFDVPLQGKAEMKVGADGRLATATIDLTGSGGALNLEGPLAQAAGFASPAQRLGVRTLSLRGSFDATLSKLAIDGASIAFVPGTTLYVPSPVDHRFPLAGLTAAGSYQDGRASVTSALLDLEGLKLAMVGSAENVDTAPAGSLTLRAENVRVDEFPRYWPKKLAPGAWEWCTTRLHDGVVPSLSANFTFATRAGATEVTGLDARFDVQRLSVDYLPPLPPVHNASGTATADLKSLRIDIDGGEAAGLVVRDGSVVFPNLDRDPPNINIDLLVSGPVRAAMGLISHPPLEYTQRLGIKPEQASGETLTRLQLRFPLLDDLKDEDMEVDAVVDLRDFGIAGVVDGIDITGGQARLLIDETGLRADGRLTVAGVDGELRLNTSFVDDAETQVAAHFDAADVPLARVRRALRNVVDLDRYLVGGAFTGRVNYELSGKGVGTVETTMDLTRAALAIPEIRWSKEAGPAGALDAVVHMQDDRVTSVPNVELLAPGLDVGGALQLDGKGQPAGIEICRFAAGRTNLSGTVARLPDGRWDIGLTGIGLDLEPLLASDSTAKDTPRSKSGPRFDGIPDFSLTADLETLWLDDAAPVRDLRATVVHERDRWMLVQMQGNLIDGSAVELSVAPDDQGGRALRLEAENAGEALRAFHVIPDVRGGTIEAKGRFDDNDPARPLSGRVRVRGFHVVNAPILARLLSVMAVTGIRDALTGRGIAFTTFEMPFSLSDDILDITDGRAYGWSLGMTFAGRVDTRADIVDVSGRLVPFYAINSALGRLPILGPVMTGGEKGGGVFSASYQVVGPLDDPNISVNTASVLFPGFLRWFLEVLSGWVGGVPSNGDENLLLPEING